MKSKSLLSLLLALVLVISFAVPVSAAASYKEKAQDAILAELADYGVVNNTEVSRIVKSMTTDQLETVEFYQDDLTAWAEQLRSAIDGVLESDMSNDEKVVQIRTLIREAYAEVADILEEVGLTVDISGLQVTVQGDTFYVEGIKITNGNVVADIRIPVNATNSSNVQAQTSRIPTQTSNYGYNTPGVVTTPSSLVNNNPLGQKTGDNGLAIALICLAVVGGALVAGTRKGASL